MRLVFFVLQYGPAIPSREHFPFRFSVLGQGGAGRARFLTATEHV
jgi:hypothetical protein